MVFEFETPYTLKKINKWIENKEIIFPASNDKYPARKEYLSEYKNQKQLISFLGLFSTKADTEILYNLFDDKKIFSNPKPLDLIKFLVEQTTNKDDIILDFFAGSGTTGEAVMRLNAEHGGNRKYVLVQLDEPIKEKNNKEAYAFVKNELKKEPTIFEIAAERLRRAGAKIEQTQQEKPQEKSTLDTGFKIFALAKDKNNEIHCIKHSEQKQLPTKLPKITIQNETLLYNMLLGAGIPFQEKIHCLIKNTCYSLKNIFLFCKFKEFLDF